jgi:catechol 2,3-dioxygenase
MQDDVPATAELTSDLRSNRAGAPSWRMDKRTNDQGPLEPGIAIGHVHVKVTDLDRAIAFYKRALGFEITQRTGHGVFLGSGSQGQIGLNTDASPDGAAPGACRFSVRYPDRLALARALSRATAAGVALDGALDHGIFEALYLRDPDGNTIELYYDRPSEAVSTEPLSVPLPLDVAALRVIAEEQAAAGRVAPPGIGPALKERLREVRSRLLDLHKVLLDDTTAAYELDRGRIPSNATLLHLVINDPWFAWLHPLSELVVRIDVALQPDGAATEADGTMLLEQVEQLLSPAHAVEPFARRYYEALQRQPAVITAHGDVRRVLKRAK